MSRLSQASLDRRAFLGLTASAAAGLAADWRLAWAAGDEVLPVAGIATIYFRNSHADVIFGKILEGFNQKGGHGPKLKLASLHVEQIGKNDLSRELCKKYEVPMFDSIDKAVTIGGKGLPAGVLSVAEHGNYPYTEKTRQHMYPRRRFFDAIVDTFEKYGKVVPLFNDKHLAYNWADADHMYRRAKQMKIPFMAGSSLPTTWREPALTLPMGVEIEEAMVIGYGGAESYGFHALEGLQCMIERRKGGETGVARILAASGDNLWTAEQKGEWSRDLVEAAVSIQPKQEDFQFDDKAEKKLQKSGKVYLCDYKDGLKASVFMANGVAREMSFAARVKYPPDGATKPRRKIVRCNFSLEYDQPYGHFSWFLQAIEHMIHTGKPAVPVERTLLVTGVLDRMMHSLVGSQEWVDTPELAAIQYQPADWGFANTEKYLPPPKK